MLHLRRGSTRTKLTVNWGQFKVNRLSSRISTPLFWSTASNLGSQLTSFLTFVILARILGAESFGIVASAALVIDILIISSNLGLSEAVIQRKDLTEIDADTAFWISFFLGLLFYISISFASLLTYKLIGRAEFCAIIASLALIFAITPLGAIHAARLTRELNFRAIAMRNLLASMAGSGIGLTLVD